ncbi:hypothetical protein M514_04846 [Trichuris suis]|uniref:Uncharacterized protein n=1 Tax=Trichuris suis TaxID=68888 RepID=A0A085NUJ5_9BILA|nr:hypothetical protein M513_04846 [Trichuris suis]KFD73141.1 hypothetical protein M514_04846 [Trichuris suis]
MFFLKRRKTSCARIKQRIDRSLRFHIALAQKQYCTGQIKELQVRARKKVNASVKKGDRIDCSQQNRLESICLAAGCTVHTRTANVRTNTSKTANTMEKYEH